MGVIRQGQTYRIAVASDEGVKKAVVSFRQGGESREFASVDRQGGSVYVSLTQDDTLGMKPGSYEMQAKCAMEDGSVVLSGITSGVVLESISKEAMDAR